MAKKKSKRSLTKLEQPQSHLDLDVETPPEVRLPEPEEDLWEILDDLINAISLVAVAKKSLGHQEIAGDEYACLKIALKHLLDSHNRLDMTAMIIAPSREEKDGQGEEGSGGTLLRRGSKRTPP